MPFVNIAVQAYSHAIKIVIDIFPSKMNTVITSLYYCKGRGKNFLNACTSNLHSA